MKNEEFATALQLKNEDGLMSEGEEFATAVNIIVFLSGRFLYKSRS